MSRNRTGVTGNVVSVVDAYNVQAGGSSYSNNNKKKKGRSKNCFQ